MRGDESLSWRSEVWCAWQGTDGPATSQCIFGKTCRREAAVPHKQREHLEQLVHNIDERKEEHNSNIRNHIGFTATPRCTSCTKCIHPYSRHSQKINISDPKVNISHENTEGYVGQNVTSQKLFWFGSPSWPWTSIQFIIGLIYRDKHAQIHIFGQFRGLWEEARVFGGTPRRLGENMQTPHRKVLPQMGTETMTRWRQKDLH